MLALLGHDPCVSDQRGLGFRVQGSGFRVVLFLGDYMGLELVPRARSQKMLDPNSVGFVGIIFTALIRILLRVLIDSLFPHDEIIFP